MKKTINEFRKGMNDFGALISTLVNSLLLLIVYFVGVGITALLAKFAKKQFLELKIAKETKTYWKELRYAKKSIKEQYRQF